MDYYFYFYSYILIIIIIVIEGAIVTYFPFINSTIFKIFEIKVDCKTFLYQFLKFTPYFEKYWLSSLKKCFIKIIYNFDEY